MTELFGILIVIITQISTSVKIHRIIDKSQFCGILTLKSKINFAVYSFDVCMKVTILVAYNTLDGRLWCSFTSCS